MSDKVFQIVMDHWIKEDIGARKKELWKRSKDACQKILLNRTTILRFEEVILRLRGENLPQPERSELQDLAKVLVLDLYHKHQIYGFCEGCNKGRVYFLVARNFSRSVIASCHICGKIKNWWQNVFEEGEFFDNVQNG